MRSIFVEASGDRVIHHLLELVPCHRVRPLSEYTGYFRHERVRYRANGYAPSIPLCPTNGSRDVDSLGGGTGAGRPQDGAGWRVPRHWRNSRRRLTIALDVLKYVVVRLLYGSHFHRLVSVAETESSRAFALI